MTLKWPASHLLATSLSMVGAGKNPALGIGVGGEMGCQPTGIWRGWKQIGSARKAFGRRGKIVGTTGSRDGFITIAESAGAFRRKNRTAVPLLDLETRQLDLLLEIGNNPVSCTAETFRARGSGLGTAKNVQLLVDRPVWSPKRQSRCLHLACTQKDPTSLARNGRQMLSSFCPSVTSISTQKLVGQLHHSRESRFTAVPSVSLFTPPGKAYGTELGRLPIGAWPSVQRRLSCFKSENLRWRRIFKVFSEEVDSRQVVPNDSKNGERHGENVVETPTGGTEEFEGVIGRGSDELVESTGKGVLQEAEFEVNEQEQVSKADRDFDIPHLNAVPDKVHPSDVTVICFDIETTGLHPAYHRIIEFAARDLSGGEYSTIETLVNPDREVPQESERIHKISSKMVNNPNVPRWKDVALAIVRFVESRRKGQGPVILVAHNGKRFDVPFIMKEFHDCGVPVPSYWRFADTMPLARSAMKSLGQKRPKVALTDLFNHYNLQSVGDAHRAMADVNMLAPVLQMVMNDLSMGVQELLEQSFSAEELMDKGKALAVNDVRAMDEIYDGVEMDVLETAVSSEVLQTFSLERTSQSYEAILGIETSNEVGEALRVSSVPWDSSSENPHLQSEDEFEKSLGLSLGHVREVSLNQPIIEMEEERPKHDRSRLRFGHDELLPRWDGDSSLSEVETVGSVSSHSPSEEVATAYREEDQIQTVGTVMDAKVESDLPDAWKEMSSSPPGAENSLEDIVSKWRGDRGEVGDLILEDHVESFSQKTVKSQMGSNGSVCYSDKTVVLNSRVLSEGDDASLLTSTVDISLLSPMMRQYVETKRQRDPKFLLLSQVGDFYEAFFEDARRLADACNLRLTAKDGGKLLKRKIPMAGVPVQHIDKNLHTLLGKGIPVVRQEQVGDEETGVAIERRVTAVLTPGTLVDGSMLEESYNNFLAAIVPPSVDDGTWGLAFSDISTGEFQATEVQGKEAFVQEILRLQPAEILIPVGSMGQIDVDSPTPLGLPSQFCYSSRPQAEFSRVQTEKKLQSHYGAVSLEAMGIASFPRALRAAGGLLGYVQETQQMASEDLPLQKLKYYYASDSMYLSETVRKHLEMTTTSRLGKAEGSFIWAVDETRTSMGRRMLQKWLLWPLLQPKKIIERQDAVDVFVKDSEARRALRLELELIGDLERLTGRVGWKRANARDMLTVAQSLQALPKLATIVEGLSSNPYIKAVLKTPIAAIEMACRVQEVLVDESGSRFPGELIKSGVDTALDELREDVERFDESIALYQKQEQSRTGIASLEVGYTKPQGRFISIRKTRLKDCDLPEDYQSVQSLKSEERFTTPVLLEYERLRSEALKKAADREEELFMLLKDEMSALLEPIQVYSKTLAEVDVLCNFAELAVKWGYCRPQIMEAGREVTIVKGRHPVVERCLPSGVNFVPNSTYLGYSAGSQRSSSPHSALVAVPVNEVTEDGNAADQVPGPMGTEESGNLTCDGSESSWPRPDVMILTGPNASGKSCYLRQIGLIQILSQAGSFVPAGECRLSVCDGLYTRVGSVDDLAAGQSTFKVEMSESAAILEKATPRSLVLLDEVGRGTGSVEGEMIARAIIEYLAQQVKARTVFSTHYHELHVLDLELENVSNYHLEAVETSSGDIVFDHTVRPGYALRSYAVGVARASGMPEWICMRASELLAKLTVADGSGDKMIGPTTLKDNEIERQSSNGLTDKHLLERSFEDEKQSGILVGNTSGMRNTVRGGKTSDSWFEVIKFSKRGKSKRARVRTEHEAGEVDVSYLEESESTAVSENVGAREEQGECEEREVETSSWREERTRDSDVEAELTSNTGGREIGYLTEKGLNDIWNRVCATLQNRPATQALTKQKGILISITRSSDSVTVRMGASALFVKKFQQYEHASALEAAFSAVLKQSVKLDVSILDTNDKKQ